MYGTEKCGGGKRPEQLITARIGGTPRRLRLKVVCFATKGEDWSNTLLNVDRSLLVAI